ncbi:MAG: hypothetical protein COA79_25700 [Planctomycetota bacterium]|nr:MAG: hypothetical protein COA79_25700 [Planctomycetota bacterium]
MKSNLIIIGIIAILVVIGMGLFLMAYDTNFDEILPVLDQESPNIEIDHLEKRSNYKIKKDSTIMPSNLVLKENSELRKTLTRKRPIQKEFDLALKKEKTSKIKHSKKNIKIKKEIYSKFEIELFDVDSNQLIRNTKGVIGFIRENIITRSEDFITDKNGRFICNMYKRGYFGFYVDVEGYALSRDIKHYILRPSDFHLFNLSKGGSLHITVTDPKGKKIEKINAGIAKSSFRVRSNPLPYNHSFNNQTGTHEFSQITSGLNHVMIKSEGYQSSKAYSVDIKPNSIAKLNIQLADNSTLIFSLPGISKLPPSILVVAEAKEADGDSIYRTREGLLELFLNENNQYVYRKINENLSKLYFIAYGYLPATVSIVKGKSAYDVKFEKGIEYKLVLLNEDKEPIPGLEVTYYSYGSINAISNLKGEVLLWGITHKDRLSLEIEPKDYFAINGLNINLEKNIDKYVKEIILRKPLKIVGTVKYKDKLIKDASITFKLTSRKKRSYIHGFRKDGSGQKVQTDEKGNFLVNWLIKGTYKITAFHKEYGQQIIKDFVVSQNNEKVFIDLSPGKNYKIHFIHEDLSPYKLQDVHISSKNRSVSYTTDEDGLLSLKNMIDGRHTAWVPDLNYRVKNRSFSFPEANNTTITIRKKSTIKLKIFDQSGPLKMRGIDIKIFSCSNKNKHRRQSEIKNVFNIIDESNIILSPYIAPRTISSTFYIVRVKNYLPFVFGPFDEVWSGEKEVQVVLKNSEKISIHVINKYTGQSIKNANITFYDKNKSLSTFTTNVNGELSVFKPSKVFKIRATHHNHSALEVNINDTTQKHITMELNYGGTLKGKVKPIDNGTTVNVYLHKVGQNPYRGISKEITKDGLFKFEHVIPGKYKLSTMNWNLYGKKEKKTFQKTIIIEEEKITEFNLVDEKKTTLDIKIIENGVLVTKHISAELSNRVGKVIYNLNISNGVYHLSTIYPGEYFINLIHNKKRITKKIIIKNLIKNKVKLSLSDSIINITVRNEENEIIPKALVNLYIGHQFESLDSYIGQQSVTKNGSIKLHLTSNQYHYLVIEEELKFNYLPSVIGPFRLDSNQTKNIEVVLMNARNLPKLLITDKKSHPLEDVAFISSSEKIPFMQRASWKAAGLHPFSDKNGYLPENGWPLSDFYLSVTKMGYETLTVFIPQGFDPEKILQIKLKPEATITCKINLTISRPISIGLMNKSGKLLNKPIPIEDRNIKELNLYKLSITNGALTFRNLTAGNYYIGYFWNGTIEEISRQGPLRVSTGQALQVDSNLILAE